MPDHDRLHSLDAVRAFALLAGIVLHAGMSFFPITGGSPWLVTDNSQSLIPQAMFYVIHIFRMATFYFIAGFFARMVFHRKGAAGFLRDRAKRIFVPLLVGWATMGPLVIVALIWGLKLSGLTGGEPPPAEDFPKLDFPLFHLWFLYYLLLLYAVVLAVRWGFVKFLDAGGGIRSRLDRWLRWSVQGSVAPLMLAAPPALCLYFTPDWILWLGIPTPDMTLTPQVPALVGYGTAFAFGWLLHRQMNLLQVWKKRWLLHLALAAAATFFSYRMVSSASDAAGAVPDSLKMAYAAAYCFAVWNWVFAIVGIGLRFFSGASAARRYVSDSSYWLYLTHLPLVLALQAVVTQWPLHWSLKFAFIVIVTTVLLLLSYHYLVRFTYIGEILNGRRRRHSKTIAAPVPPPVIKSTTADSPDSVVAELSGVYKSYGTTVALEGIDLQVPRGKLLSILGPNGAGKTTAISLLLGLTEPDAGSASLFGQPPEFLEARRRVGVILQEVALPPDSCACELIDLAASYYPDPMTLDEVVDQTRISSLVRRPYGKLSGGQKRQVQFAMAMVGRPRLLFLDEPTAGLDVQSRETMWTLMRGLVSRGTSIVLTTHYLEEAEALADRVAVLAKGRLAALGSVNEVRSLVARKQIRCLTRLNSRQIEHWPGVKSVSRAGHQLHITVMDAETVVRLLLSEDPDLRELEVSRAGLAEAFTEITKEAVQ